ARARPALCLASHLSRISRDKRVAEWRFLVPCHRLFTLCRARWTISEASTRAALFRNAEHPDSCSLPSREGVWANSFSERWTFLAIPPREATSRQHFCR